MKQLFLNPAVRKLSLFFALALALVVLAIYLIGIGGGSSNAGKTPGFEVELRTAHITETKIVLNWDLIDNAREYEVYRAIGEGERTRIYNGSGNTFSDARHSPGQTYTYWIRVVFANNTSHESSPKYVLPIGSPPPPPPPPGPPAVSPTAGKDFAQFRIRVSGDDIDNVIVERKDPGEADFRQIKILAPSETAFTDAGLQPGTRYEYRFFASAGGNLSRAKAVTVTTPKERTSQKTTTTTTTTTTPVLLPPIAAVDDKGDNFVKLSWNYQNGYVEQVIIERKAPSGNRFAGLVTLGAGEKSFTDYNVEPGNTYQYQFKIAYKGQSSKPGQMLAVEIPRKPDKEPEISGPDLTGNKDYFRKGEAAFKSGNYGEAESNLSKVQKPAGEIEQRKEYLNARIYLGQIALKRANYRGAMNYLQEAAQIQSNRPDVYYWLANASLGLEDYHSAIGFFEKVHLYKLNLSRETGKEAIFNTDYGIIVSYYHLWQNESDETQKTAHQQECVNLAEHFLRKYPPGQSIGPEKDFQLKRKNVEIYQQNLITR